MLLYHAELGDRFESTIIVFPDHCVSELVLVEPIELVYYAVISDYVKFNKKIRFPPLSWVRMQQFPASCFGLVPVGGFNGAAWKMRKLDRSGNCLRRQLPSSWQSIPVFSLPSRLAALLSSTPAQTLSQTWQKATRKWLAVVRRSDSKNSRSSRLTA